ncbi:alkaline phosphatase [Cloacibacillus sp.]
MNLFTDKKKVVAAVALGLSCALTACIPNPALARYSAPQEETVRVLPINRAKFLQGQKFDFAVEVKNGSASEIQVTVNGKDAAAFFGKKASTSMEGPIAVYRIDDVSFPKSGKYTVSVTDADGRRSVEYSVTDEKSKKRAKNVILLIGDGMSVQAREIARILSKGITEGKYNDLLNMEKMPHMALITTSGYDSLVTDSANSASAYATGHKSVVNAMGVYENCTKDPLDDPKVENIIELAKRTRGMATGIVSTSNITDATPAAMLAHTRRRAELNYIAQDMLTERHRPDVILGGGSANFLPKSVNGSKRKDDVNVIKGFEDLGYRFSSTKSELDKIPAEADKLLGLYHLNHMNVYVDRAMLKNPKVLGGFDDQPGLVEMTDKAIRALSKNKNGFFLMVEGACIDKQLHVLDWQRAAYDNIEFDQAVGVAQKFAEKNPDTMIVVVADHAHGASITGTYHELDGKKGREAVRTYADAKWTTFEDLDGDGYPDDPNPSVTLAVQFANHPDTNVDYRFKQVPTDPAIMSGDKAVANPNIKGELAPGNIPAADSQEVHSADDILLNAQGPGSEYFRGVMDNTEVFFGIVRALGLDGNKNVK